MNLYIDIGNSRIKWLMLPKIDNAVTQSFCYDIAHIEVAMEDSFSMLTNVGLKNIYISNVAGNQIELKVTLWFTDRLHIKPQFALSSAKTQYLISSYTEPETLGIDRLLAMLAAVPLIDTNPCVVVDCGTATTIDCVSDTHIFLGGLIIPGLELMQLTLSKNTDALKLIGNNQKVTCFATDTESAIFSGAILATTQVIENSLQELTQKTGLEARCIITGGNGEIIQYHLNCAATYRAELVLEGLSIYF